MLKRSCFLWSRIVGFVLPALLALTLVACSSAPTYQEPVVSEPSQLATIRGSMVETDWLYADQFTTVSGIDESVPRGMSYDQPINVRPGYHKMRLYFRQGNQYATVEMETFLESGRSYVVKSEVVEAEDWWSADKVRFWIEDASSGDVVRGRAPGPGSEVMETPTPPPYIPVK